MDTDRIAPAQAATETKPDVSDPKPVEAKPGEAKPGEAKSGEAPKRDAITRAAAQRSPTQRAMLGAGVLALMALSAGAYFYSVWDASHDIANRSTSAPPASDRKSVV